MAIAVLPNGSFSDAFPASRPALRLLPIPGGATGAADREAVIRPLVPRVGQLSQPRVRRRQIALLSVTLVCLVLLAGPIRALGGSSSPAVGSLSPGSVYTVKAGDTLWTIAQRLDPSGDPRSTVAQLATETGSDRIVPGEHIRLP
jgi:nucleoid-associated protein YgaU